MTTEGLNAESQASRNSGPRLEFWFDLASNYSYLSVMRIQELAERHGVAVAWRPFLLGPIFREQGWETSPFVLQEAKGRYVWRDMERLCRKYGLPWRKPSQFPRRAVLPTRIALLGSGEPWGPEFCRRIMRLNFGEDREVEGEDMARQVLMELGLDADGILREAQSDPMRQRLREQTAMARAKGVFGAPTFFAISDRFVNGDMFWGNDRLEDALEALSPAFAGS